MKNLLYVSWCLLAASLVFGAECRKYNRPYVSARERNEPFQLENSLSRYVVTWRYLCPTPTQSAQLLIGMPLPVHKTGFGTREFTGITINGIDSRMLEPKKFEIFNTKESSGVDVHYNFDGIPMIQRFSVSDSLPLLTMTWLRGKGKPVQPIRTMVVRFIITPCTAGPARGSFARQVVSAQKVYSAGQNGGMLKQKLSAKDGCLIFQDARHEGGKGKTYGSPVLLRPDWKSIRSGQVRFGNQPNVSVNFILDPKASSWSFGMLETEIKHTNAEFADFVKKQGIIP